MVTKKSEIKEQEWKVESFTTPGKSYLVKRQGDKLTCSCPAFKKFKKACKHIQKVLGENPTGKYELKTKDGHPLDEVISALQKCIRRAEEYKAAYFAYTLHISGFGKYLWRRLSVISCEDCGTANPLTPVVVNSLRQMWENNIKSVKEPTLSDFLFPLQAILFLCRVEKCREGDSLANIVKEDFEARKGPEIPEYALDPHTAQGKAKWGRWNTGTKEQNQTRVKMWFNVWSAVSNPKGNDKWVEELKKRWGYY